MSLENPTQKSEILGVVAASGTGKTSLCKHLLMQRIFNLEFSISCTNRKPRGHELNGVDYWFKQLEEMIRMQKEQEFIECVEVYPNRFYATPISEIERIRNNHHNALLDIDVQGGVLLKEKFPEAKIIFIKPPSKEELRRRLEVRGDTSLDEIEVRLDKSLKEIAFGEEQCAKGVFNACMINDNIETAKTTITNIAACFLGLTRSA